MGVIFVGGVHGVGKSTCCQQVSEQTGLQWFTASALIQAERQTAITGTSKSVLNPDSNQDLLVRAVGEYIAAKDTKIILNGHFTLLKTNGEIVTIEPNVFSKLGVEKLVVLRDDPVAICNRLKERDKRDWSLPFITTHQEAEIAHAYAVASFLHITIFSVGIHDFEGLMRAVGAIRE